VIRSLLTPGQLVFRVAVGLAVLAVVCAACVMVGSQQVRLSEAMRGPGRAGEVNPDYEILVNIRLPRVVLAAVVGAALACSGVVFQALLRNPLADPYILGISSGAGLGAMLAVIGGFNWTVLGRSPVGLFAFMGAMGTVWLVWWIGRLAGRAQMTGLLLAGVVVNAFLSAIILFLTSVARSEMVYSTVFWLMGNMTEGDSRMIWVAAGFVLTGIGALYLLAGGLNALSFGEQDARSMGIYPARLRLAAFAAASAVTAVAVSLSGLIGFVGLVVPHGVRLVFGSDHRQLVPLSAIAGAIFLTGADTIARVIVAPAQLPVGVITAIAGGPLFLVLLVRYCRRVGGIR